MERRSQRRHPRPCGKLQAEGRKTYVVPYGVSNPLGAVAYASTVAEIAEQCAALGFVPGAIAHCSGSAGTQAGLVVGARVCLPATRIVGIDIDAEPERVRADVLAYGRAAADLLDQPFDEADVEVVAGHAGPAYGVPHARPSRRSGSPRGSRRWSSIRSIRARASPA